MAKYTVGPKNTYTVRYEVTGFIDIQIGADSVDEALKLPMSKHLSIVGGEHVTVAYSLSNPDLDWTPKIAYSEEGERIYG